MIVREIHHGEPSFDLFVQALVEAGLPIDDLTKEPATFYTVKDKAWCGLTAGPDAMLRSVVVVPELRGAGHGVELVHGVCDIARNSNVTSVWLLTTSASAFFGRLGWGVVNRENAPAVVRASEQFRALCPASATLMVRRL